MGAFSRLRYVIAANVNALIEKAEDPEKLLRALIREMEDASDEARLASADLLAEQQHLDGLETQLSEQITQWQHRAENAVSDNRDDLGRAALRAKAELTSRHESVVGEQAILRDRINQMEQDMVTLKAKLAESKVKLKGMIDGREPHQVVREHEERLSPSEKKVRRALGRFDRLQAQVESLEARVRSYEVGGPGVRVWDTDAPSETDPVIEAELDKLKGRIRGVKVAQSNPTPETSAELKAEPESDGAVEQLAEQDTSNATGEAEKT
jgi:phage shock protein A